MICTTWIVIATLALGTVAFKTLGPLLAGGAQPPAALSRVIELLTPALLTSLVITSTLDDGGNLVFGYRTVGVLVGAALLLRRAPLLLALVVAAATAAAVQALF